MISNFQPNTQSTAGSSPYRAETGAEAPATPPPSNTVPPASEQPLTGMDVYGHIYNTIFAGVYVTLEEDYANRMIKLGEDMQRTQTNLLLPDLVGTDLEETEDA